MSLDSLLVDTLAHAARAPFYRSRWGQRWKSVKTVEQLSRLPLLDKPTASKHQHALVVGPRPAGVGIVSSGTTRGEAYVDPLNVPRSAEELAAAASTVVAGDGGFPGWTLSVVSVHHGLPKRLAGRDELMLPWLHDANALAMLETTLRAPQPDGRRVTAMVIGSGPLKVFTAYLAERGVDPRAFGVKLIGTFSYRLSSTWRALVASRFGATVFDNYSLSEFPTPFTTCEHCGWLHTGQPPMVVELLDLHADRPVRRGPGRLVFTSLVPWVTTMPLIRYDTHDVAITGPTCRATGQTGLKVLGRRRHGLDLEGQFLLNAVDVREVLEALPESAKTLHPMARLGHVKSVELGPPRWTVAAEGKKAALRFEVRFDPDVYRGRARALEHHVAKELCRLDAATRRFGRKRLVVQAVAEGSIRALSERYD